MSSPELLFNESPWLILVCLLVGAFYALLLYSKKTPWSKSTNYILAAIRFALISFLGFLILGPFIKILKNTIEKPMFVLAIDNSESLSNAMDSTDIRKVFNEIEGITREIGPEQIAILSLDGNVAQSIREIQFDGKSSDLNKLLKIIEQDYEGKNLAGVTLISDGIYNRGSSPTYTSFGFPINTIGMGDTVPKQDIYLKAIYYNKVAYQGNKFTVRAEISHAGFEGERIEVSISKNGKILNRKSSQLGKDGRLTEVEFIVDAISNGLQHYVIQVNPKVNEFTMANNRRDAYIEIVEGNKKILLLALAPHPDIKALGSILLSNDNYELTQFIPGIKEPKIENGLIFDLVIYHQFPSLRRTNLNLLNKHIAPSTSLLYMVGSQTDLNEFNKINEVALVEKKSMKADAVSPLINSNFSMFGLNRDYHNQIESFPTISAAFGNYTLQANAEALLYQRFGSVETEKPLLAVRQLEKHKVGVIMGDGIWRWRMQEYADTQESVAFTELFSKVIQYLSTTEDNKRFRAYPVNQEFTDNQSVEIETEVYNSLYEAIYNQKIAISIRDESGVSNNYSFINSELNKRFKLNGLEQGVYTFTASTVLEGRTEKSSGSFSIKKLQLESINLTADHNLLRNLSAKSGGEFFTSDQITDAFKNINSGNTKSIIHSEKEFQSLINIRWLFFLILFVISLEWFIRKYSGGY